jgi:very-short-patch-repair endonuclease
LLWGSFLTRRLPQRRDLSSFSGQKITNTLWAFACMDAMDVPSVKKWLQSPELGPVSINRTLGHASQLFLARLAWNQTHTEPSPLLSQLDQDGWIDDMVRSQKSIKASRAHMHVSQLLCEQFLEEEKISDKAILLDGLCVDIFFKKTKAVVEVDGPTRFLNTGERDGSTLFKHRLLERAGYRVFPMQATRFMEFGHAEQESILAQLAGRIKKE